MKTLIYLSSMLFGALLLLIAPLTLLSPDSFEIATVELSKIEAGAASLPDQVRITGGRLYWPAAMESVQENLRTKAATSNGWFVPLISGTLLATFEAAEVAGQPVPVELCRVMAKLPPELVEEQFAQLPTGESEEIAPAFELIGTAKPGRALPLHIKRGLEEQGSALEIDRLVYVEHGSDLAAWQAGLSLAVFGGLLFGFGYRRRKNATRARAL